MLPSVWWHLTQPDPEKSAVCLQLEAIFLAPKVLCQILGTLGKTQKHILRLW